MRNGIKDQGLSATMGYVRERVRAGISVGLTYIHNSDKVYRPGRLLRIVWSRFGSRLALSEAVTASRDAHTPSHIANYHRLSGSFSDSHAERPRWMHSKGHIATIKHGTRYAKDLILV